MKFLKGLGYVAAGLWVFLFSRGAALGITLALFPTESTSDSFLFIDFVVWLLIGPGAVALILFTGRKIRDYRKRKAKAAEEQERLAADARKQARNEGLTQGRKEGVAKGLAQGREEGFSLGHSEGYKYALYTQGRFRYYDETPPLSYEEARRSLDEGQEGTNGELIQEPSKDGSIPVESTEQRSAPATGTKREDPSTHRNYTASLLPPLRRTIGGLDFESYWAPIPRDDFSERPTEDTVIAFLEPEE